MADADWDNVDESGAAVATGAAPIMAEMPEIKLFGKWSCDDVAAEAVFACEVKKMRTEKMKPLVQVS